jgi:hypothetical protein
MQESSVNAAVQTKVQDIVALQYGVGVQKIQITEHHSDSAMAKTTTLTLMVKTPRKRGDVSDFSEYSIKQHKKEMVTKIDTALVVATYKDAPKDQNDQQDHTNSGETTENSNNMILLWLLLALLLIMVMGFALYTRQKVKNPADYTAMQTQNQQNQRDMDVNQGRANPYWHPMPMPMPMQY